MLTEIYSKVDPEKVLHMVHRIDGSEEGRRDLVDAKEFLQCSFLKMERDKTFKPHKHLQKKPEFDTFIAQESWVVIKGSVMFFFYDLDDSLIGFEILKVGDISITLGGGHNYRALEEDTLVYEFKTGPYYGHESDKTFIMDNRK